MLVRFSTIPSPPHSTFSPHSTTSTLARPSPAPPSPPPRPSTSLPQQPTPMRTRMRPSAASLPSKVLNPHVPPSSSDFGCYLPITISGGNTSSWSWAGWRHYDGAGRSSGYQILPSLPRLLGKRVQVAKDRLDRKGKMLGKLFSADNSFCKRYGPLSLPHQSRLDHLHQTPTAGSTSEKAFSRRFGRTRVRYGQRVSRLSTAIWRRWLSGVGGQERRRGCCS